MKLRILQIAGTLAFLAIVLFLVPGAPSAFAQAGRGSVSGTVTAPSGAIVPGASVTLLNPGTGVALHTVTTAAGPPRKDGYKVISEDATVTVIATERDGLSDPQTFTFLDAKTMRWAASPGKAIVFTKE